MVFAGGLRVRSPRGCTRRRHDRRPHQPGPRRSGGDRGAHRHRADQRATSRRRYVDDRRASHFLWGRGTVDMKAGVAVQLKLAAELVDPTRRHHLDVVRPRGGRRRPQRPHPRSRAHARPLRRRLRDPGRAVATARSRAAATATCASIVRTLRRARPLARAPGWATTPSTRPRRSSAASRTTSRAMSRVDGLVYREGLNAGPHQRWGGRQRHPRRCAMVAGQLPLRAQPRSPRRPSAHVRDVFSGFDVEIVDAAAGRPSGLDAPLAQAFLAAVGARAPAEVRLDRRGPVQRAGRPRRELRPGRPARWRTHDEERVPVAADRGRSSGACARG